MSSAYENAMSDLQANNYTQKYPIDQQRKYCPDCGSLLPDETHEDWCFCKQYEQRAEAAESRAAQAEAERDELARKLEEIKSILAGGRTVGGDIEQAYRDAEEIAEDGANAHKAMIQ